MWSVNQSVDHSVNQTVYCWSALIARYALFADAGPSVVRCPSPAVAMFRKHNQYRLVVTVERNIQVCTTDSVATLRSCPRRPPPGEATAPSGEITLASSLYIAEALFFIRHCQWRHLWTGRRVRDHDLVLHVACVYVCMSRRHVCAGT